MVRRWGVGRTASVTVVLFLGLALSALAAEKEAMRPKVPPPAEVEAAVSLDVRDADARGIVLALAELGGVQVVFDASVECRLTLNVKQMPLSKVLDVTLRACRLDSEQDGRVVRVTTPARLAEESQARRALQEAKDRSRPASMVLVRLSYSRAAELAPVVEKQLSPRGRVVLDARTNTLLIID